MVVTQNVDFFRQNMSGWNDCCHSQEPLQTKYLNEINALTKLGSDATKTRTVLMTMCQNMRTRKQILAAV